MLTTALDHVIIHQVKQLMRWHCRLSHVAAHTALLTGNLHFYFTPFLNDFTSRDLSCAVYTDQLIAKPVTELEKMLTFAGHKPDRESLLGAIKEHMPVLAAEWDDLAVIRASFGNISHLVTGTITTADLDAIFSKAVAALQKEMVESQNLTKWPCKSFRDFKDKTVIEQLPLPVKSLAADCAAPHVKCSVRYDTEEHKRNSQPS